LLHILKNRDSIDTN